MSDPLNLNPTERRALAAMADRMCAGATWSQIRDIRFGGERFATHLRRIHDRAEILQPGAKSG